MSEAKQFTIGSEVACADGTCGELSRVVVDPVARTLTHLVVAPADRAQAARLAPVELVDSTASELRLRCTRLEFEALEEAEETQFLPGASGPWGYRQDQMLSLPYYGLGMGIGGLDMGSGVGMGGLGIGGVGIGPHEIISERVPVGEVDVRRGEHVHATDGAIGRVQGLIIDPADHHVTHVLLDEGHLWGQKRVAVPISAVTSVADGVRLNLTKDQVRDLPPVDVDLDRGE
ncbi:MAG: PRC-barrel domain-containing protein [Solirubrobacteraceae bacterium]